MGLCKREGLVCHYVGYVGGISRSPPAVPCALCLIVRSGDSRIILLQENDDSCL